MDSDDEMANARDEIYGPSSAIHAKGHEYRIKNALKPPRSTTYTAQALYGMQNLDITTQHPSQQFLI